MGDADFVEQMIKLRDKIDESAEDAAGQFIKKRLDGQKAERESIEGFKKSLAEVAKRSPEPIVIFLDELDRCRPDFAIKTIERVKHFFEVPDVIFVLLMNRAQLAAGVRGLYGSEVDAEAYLGKFIELSFTLPKRADLEDHRAGHNRMHCIDTLERYGFEVRQRDEAAKFADAMGQIATLMDMSLRDVERAVALYSLAQSVGANARELAWPIALKLRRPTLFARLSANGPGAHAEAVELLKTMVHRSVHAKESLELFSSLHSWMSDGGRGDLAEPAKEAISAYPGPQAFMRWAFNAIDLGRGL